ncbi:MAG: DUF1449 family protein [Myxococcales bacterium]|nr:DUF1449 family protein [Myxococcales bacterium]
MTEFLHAVLAFPTVIYTVLLVVTLVYWLFVVIGALDVDALDVGDAADGLADGAADGLADGLADGAADGLADGAAEALGHGAADAIGDGAAEALGHGADGVAEGAGHAAGEASHGAASGIAGLLSALRLRSAPLTVVISLIILIAWSLSMLGMNNLSHLLPYGVLAALVGVGAFVVAVPITSLLVRPLGKVFISHTARSRADAVGHTCVVTTGRVDQRFGQADCKIGGDFLRIEVRCDPARGLRRGQEALIIEYDREREAYLVEPLDD